MVTLSKVIFLSLIETYPKINFEIVRYKSTISREANFFVREGGKRANSAQRSERAYELWPSEDSGQIGSRIDVLNSTR